MCIFKHSPPQNNFLACSMLAYQGDSYSKFTSWCASFLHAGRCFTKSIQKYYLIYNLNSTICFCIMCITALVISNKLTKIPKKCTCSTPLSQAVFLPIFPCIPPWHYLAPEPLLSVFSPSTSLLACSLTGAGVKAGYCPLPYLTSQPPLPHSPLTH